jgi:hypothetical protein
MVRIVFYRKDALEVLRYTSSMQVTQMGSLWGEAWISAVDLETFRLNGWWFEVQK